MQFRAIASRGDFAPLEITLNLPGEHNVLNALAAIAVAREVGAPEARDRQARCSEFTGVGRRFQRFGEVPLAGGGAVHAGGRLRPPPGGNGGDDRRRARRLSRPAHRARVPAASLHAHARSLRGFRESALQRRRTGARRRLPRGRAPIVAADGRALARAVRVAGRVEPVFVETVAEVPDAVRGRLKAGDVVISMGAGSVANVAPELARPAGRG